MKAGFAKIDITPRVGVELCGFGPFRNRHSIGVRDQLWARAMAVSDGGMTVVILSCDLIGVTLDITHAVRHLVEEQTGVSPEAIMVHCTHTHSGPATAAIIGWGDADMPYMELLPRRLAQACIDAVAALQPAEFAHAAAPCEGIGYNRQHDQRPSLEDALSPDWRPQQPERTDTVCHAIRIDSPETGQTIGFLSYFGCHPVVCCAETRYIHGDYAGVATNLIEADFPGSVGLFLQGAQGDVNTCVVHHPEPESLNALDVIALRYAENVRCGLRNAVAFDPEPLNCELRKATFTREKHSICELRSMLDEKEATLRRDGASDEDTDVRMAMVYAHALRTLIARMEAGTYADPVTELQGMRLGPISFLASPFETFQQIKNDVVAQAASPVTLVMGITNDCLGYAPDTETAESGGYAAKQVPFMLGELPFAEVHRELAESLLGLAESLQT
ncbi:MAG: neutral/alkaline non-lysosomal ceramidase N-terminal domain-containing protein [Lentisphaeria bacterium]|nr:neutral/alkaline non-lysosomal ceramidase N-terminal domain-containing protein [Lentisphaeria bacterium]